MSTTTSLKPITVWGQGGPNPPKVAILLAELSLPHTILPMSFAALKQPPYLAINPNGRMPAIHDPNTDLTLWESGAIIEYLIDTYDTTHKLSFPTGSHEAYLAKQFLFFQVSGQGPYYGQAAWFRKFHSERLPSAEERYSKEITRVTAVLETVLAKNRKEQSGGEGPWLVGNKLSYADLAFVSWQTIILKLFSEEELGFEAFPLVKGWVGRMSAREAVRGVLEGGEEAR